MQNIREKQRASLQHIRDMVPLESADAPLAMLTVTIGVDGELKSSAHGFDADSLLLMAEEIHVQIHNIIHQAKQLKYAGQM